MLVDILSRLEQMVRRICDQRWVRYAGEIMQTMQSAKTKKCIGEA